jgi:hypothetical protein
MPISFKVKQANRCQNLANGSRVDVLRASPGRVAHAGNGNWTSSGIGISGCDTMTVPGLRMPARARQAVVRKPYSPCCASARSSRPTTRNAELATILRSIWLAVCWAPIRTTPRLLPRHVEENIFDRAPALAWRILVELIQYNEDQWPGRT